MKKIVHTTKAPAAIGPYSQATVWNGLVFCSGQIALTGDGESLLDKSVEIQCEQALMNVQAVLIEAGASMQSVLKVNISLVDINDFHSVNTVYETFFSESKPARACVEVNGLPRGAKIEVEAIAHVL